MFAHRSLRAFICLRCQLRLVRQAHRRPTPCVGHQYRLHSDAHASKVDNAPLSPFDKLSPKSYVVKKLYPHGKVRGKPGRKVREDVQSLPIKSLGGQSEVIVLRDAGSNLPKKKENTPQEDESAPALSSEEILNAITIGKQGVRQEEVYKELEALRPSSFTDDQVVYLSRDEYISKFKAIEFGYTSTQLAKHVAALRAAQAVKADRQPERKEMLNRNTDATGVTDWRPGKSPLDQRLPIGGSGFFVPHETTEKRRLIEKLIRFYWKVEILEENESTGELEMRVLPWQHQLLTAGDSPTVLDRITQQRQVRVAVCDSGNVIRITADRLAAQYAVWDIQKTLRNAVEHTFDLEPFNIFAPETDHKRTLPYQAVDLIAKLCRTVIQTIDDTKLLIRATTQAHAENAIRSLLSLFDLPLPPKPMLLINLEHKSAKIPKGALQAFPLPDALPYRDRWKDLARWFFPVQRDGLAESSPTQELPTEEEKETTVPATRQQAWEHVQQMLRTSVGTLAKNRPNSSQTESYWQTLSRRETSVVVGYALHPFGMKRLPRKALHHFFKDRSWQKSSFCNVVPGLSHLLSRLDEPMSDELDFLNGESMPDEADVGSNVLVVRLIPNPWSKLENTPPETEPRPEVRMQFRVDPERRNGAKFEGMFAVVSEKFTDVMFPHQAADLRFIASEALWVSNKDALKDQAIAAFVKQIEDSVASRGVLRAPPKLKLRIPEWTFNFNAEAALESQSSAQKSEETSTAKEVEVEYLSGSIEHRQSVQFHFKQHSLSYTAVEAGKMGGHHGELKLWTPEGLHSSDGEQDRMQGQSERAIDAFMKAAYALVELVSEAALDRSPLRPQPRPRSAPLSDEDGDMIDMETDDGVVITEAADAVAESDGQTDVEEVQTMESALEGEGSAAPDAVDEDVYPLDTETATNPSADVDTGDTESTARRPKSFDDWLQGR